MWSLLKAFRFQPERWPQGAPASQCGAESHNDAPLAEPRLLVSKEAERLSQIELHQKVLLIHRGQSWQRIWSTRWAKVLSRPHLASCVMGWMHHRFPKILLWTPYFELPNLLVSGGPTKKTRPIAILWAIFGAATFCGEPFFLPRRCATKVQGWICFFKREVWAKVATTYLGDPEILCFLEIVWKPVLKSKNAWEMLRIWWNWVFLCEIGWSRI